MWIPQLSFQAGLCLCRRRPTATPLGRPVRSRILFDTSTAPRRLNGKGNSPEMRSRGSRGRPGGIRKACSHRTGPERVLVRFANAPLVVQHPCWTPRGGVPPDPPGGGTTAGRVVPTPHPGVRNAPPTSRRPRGNRGFAFLGGHKEPGRQTPGEPHNGNEQKRPTYFFPLHGQAKATSSAPTCGVSLLLAPLPHDCVHAPCLRRSRSLLVAAQLRRPLLASPVTILSPCVAPVLTLSLRAATILACGGNRGTACWFLRLY